MPQLDFTLAFLQIRIGLFVFIFFYTIYVFFFIPKFCFNSKLKIKLKR